MGVWTLDNFCLKTMAPSGLLTPVHKVPVPDEANDVSEGHEGIWGININWFGQQKNRFGKFIDCFPSFPFWRKISNPEKLVLPSILEQIAILIH